MGRSVKSVLMAGGATVLATAAMADTAAAQNVGESLRGQMAAARAAQANAEASQRAERGDAHGEGWQRGGGQGEDRGQRGRQFERRSPVEAAPVGEAGVAEPRAARQERYNRAVQPNVDGSGARGRDRDGDGDGIRDGRDIDGNNDGRRDWRYRDRDGNNDGRVDPRHRDRDRDGVPHVRDRNRDNDGRPDWRDNGRRHNVWRNWSHPRPSHVIVRPSGGYHYRPHWWGSSYYLFDNRYDRYGYDYGSYYRPGQGFYGGRIGSGWARLYPWLRQDAAGRHWVMWFFDDNRNGRLSKDEARDANRAFERLADRNRDGYLNDREISRGLDELRDEYRYSYSYG